MTSVEELNEIILANLNPQGVSTEAKMRIQTIGHRLDYLPTVIQLIPQSFGNTKVTYNAFLLAFKIIKTRGCLLDFNTLKSYFDQLITIINENIDFFASNPAIMDVAAQSVAISIRILFEKNPDEISALEEIHSMLESGDNFTFGALGIMREIINIFKESLRQVDITTANANLKRFRSTFGSNFCSEPLHIIINDDIPQHIMKSSLSLIKSSFKIFDDGRDQVGLISYADTYQEFFNPEVAERLIQLSTSDDPEIAQESFDVMSYYLRCSNTSFESDDAKRAFFFTIARIFSESLSSVPADARYIGTVILVIDIVCMQLNQLSPSLSEECQMFINALSSFTEEILKNVSLQDAISTIKFWDRISQWAKTDQDEITGYVIQVLSVFIDLTLANIASKVDESEADLDTIDSSQYRSIWNTAQFCWPQFSEFLASRIESTAEEAATAADDGTSFPFIQLAFLIRLSAAQLEVYKNVIGKVQGMPMMDPVITVMNAVNNSLGATSPKIEAAATNVGRNAIQTELAYVIYLRVLNKCQIPSKPISEETKNDDNRAIEAMLNSLVERMMTDLEMFIRVSECKDLLLNILAAVEELTKKQAAAVILADNAPFQALITESAPIDFDEIERHDAKSARSRLFEIYACMIQGRQQLVQHLSAFDERFQAVIASPEEGPIFGLYRDLYGFSRGIKATKQKEFIEKFITWFVDNHLDDTTTIIDASAELKDVVASISHLWDSFYRGSEDRAYETSGFGYVITPNSGIGISLFRASVKIVDAVFENCKKSSDQLRILIRLLYSTLTTKSANFGVMRYFGDNSYDTMLESFFAVLDTFSFQDIAAEKKSLVSLILKTIISITELSPESVLESADNLRRIVEFVSPCFLVDENDRILIWKDAWNCLKPLLMHALENGRPEVAEFFRPSFVYILDAVCNSPQSCVAHGVEIIPMMLTLDGEFTTAALQALIETYDQLNREEVTAVISTLVSNAGEPNAVINFMKAMSKLPTNITDSPMLFEFYPH